MEHKFAEMEQRLLQHIHTATQGAPLVTVPSSAAATPSRQRSLIQLMAPPASQGGLVSTPRRSGDCENEEEVGLFPQTPSPLKRPRSPQDQVSGGKNRVTPSLAIEA